MPETPEAFADRVGQITAWLAGRPVDAALGAQLAAAFPPHGEAFQGLAQACREGVRDGWLAQRGEAPLTWGRVIKPCGQTHGFSVDVVRMTDVAGPHHTHPQGEIDMILPLDASATFDRAGEGWLVYPPGSSHRPTVAGGAAIILYLLPNGEIQFNA
jgi:hypothetical protein